MTIGFVIASHADPEQLLRLCRALGQVYDTPSIVCHHDFAQSAVNMAHFDTNVQFVEQPERTGWGLWGVTEGIQRAIEKLYHQSDPDWFTVLSAADYPIRPASLVVQELAATQADAFMDLRPIEAGRPARHFGHYDSQLAHHDNFALAKSRFLDTRLTILPALGGRAAKRIRLPFRDPLGPFDNAYRCFVGSQWFTANRRCARRLLTPTTRDQKLRRYMQRRWHADESYYNTVIGNELSLQIDVNPRRFVRWTRGAARPEALQLTDLPAILASGAHFARTFEHTSPVLDRLDAEHANDPGGRRNFETPSQK